MATKDPKERRIDPSQAGGPAQRARRQAFARGSKQRIGEIRRERRLKAGQMQESNEEFFNRVQRQKKEQAAKTKARQQIAAAQEPKKFGGLAGFDESKHPRDQRGRFTFK